MSSAAYVPVSDDGVWFKSPEFPWFLANRAGQVMRASTGRIVGTSLSSQGYRRAMVELSVGGVRKLRQFRVHRIVASAFFGPQPKGMAIDHINGDRLDNRVENLEYVTKGENTRRAWRSGSFGDVAVSDAQVDRMVALHVEQGLSSVGISKIINRPRKTVIRHLRRRGVFTKRKPGRKASRISPAREQIDIIHAVAAGEMSPTAALDALKANHRGGSRQHAHQTLQALAWQCLRAGWRLQPPTPSRTGGAA